MAGDDGRWLEMAAAKHTCETRSTRARPCNSMLRLPNPSGLSICASAASGSASTSCMRACDQPSLVSSRKQRPSPVKQ